MRGENPNSHGNNPPIGDRRLVILPVTTWNFVERFFGKYSLGVREMTSLAEVSIKANIAEFCSLHAIAHPSKKVIEAWLAYHFPKMQGKSRACAKIAQEISLGKASIIDGRRHISAVELSIYNPHYKGYLYINDSSLPVLTMYKQEDWNRACQRAIAELNITRFADIRLTGIFEEKSEEEGMPTTTTKHKVEVEMIDEEWNFPQQRNKGTFFSWKQNVN